MICRILIVVAACIACGGCALGTHIAAVGAAEIAKSAAKNVVEHETIRKACEVTTWASRSVKLQAWISRLTPIEQEIIATAETAAASCAAGDAPDAIAEIAKGAVEVLYTPH